MRWAGGKPNNLFFATISKACTSMADLEHDRQICACIVKTALEINECVTNSIVTMYAQCGTIKDACKVFDEMSELNVEP
jgi:pentatricopeptide repeat protein